MSEKVLKMFNFAIGRTFPFTTMMPAVDDNIYTHNDVLSGRGGSINNHPGNKAFRDHVANRKRDYNLAISKIEKNRVAQDIIDLIHQNGGRYLHKNKKGGDQWVEMTHNEMMRKTTQALREGAPEIRAQAAADGEIEGYIPKKKRRRGPPMKSQVQQQGSMFPPPPVHAAMAVHPGAVAAAFAAKEKVFSDKQRAMESRLQQQKQEQHPIPEPLSMMERETTANFAGLKKPKSFKRMHSLALSDSDPTEMTELLNDPIVNPFEGDSNNNASPRKRKLTRSYSKEISKAIQENGSGTSSILARSDTDISRTLSSAAILRDISSVSIGDIDRCGSLLGVTNANKYSNGSITRMESALKAAGVEIANNIEIKQEFEDPFASDNIEDEAPVEFIDPMPRARSLLKPSSRGLSLKSLSDLPDAFDENKSSLSALPMEDALNNIRSSDVSELRPSFLKRQESLSLQIHKSSSSIPTTVSRENSDNKSNELTE